VVHTYTVTLNNRFQALADLPDDYSCVVSSILFHSLLKTDRRGSSNNKITIIKLIYRTEPGWVSMIMGFSRVSPVSSFGLIKP